MNLFESKVCDLSLLESRGLRDGTLSVIRRPVSPSPVEVRPGFWAWYVGDAEQDAVPIEEMRSRVAASGQWSTGWELLVREPWRQLDGTGKQRVQYRADGEVAERGRGGTRIVVPHGSVEAAGDWHTSFDLPDWAWRMKARVLGVDASMVTMPGHGATLWAIEYEMKVMNA